jgi:hypothetical protein
LEALDLESTQKLSASQKKKLKQKQKKAEAAAQAKLSGAAEPTRTEE